MRVSAVSPGWVEHDGQGMPVAELARIQVQFRSDPSRLVAERTSGPEGNVAHAYHDNWTHSDSPADIMAFREVVA